MFACKRIYAFSGFLLDLPLNLSPPLIIVLDSCLVLHYFFPTLFIKLMLLWPLSLKYFVSACMHTVCNSSRSPILPIVNSTVCDQLICTDSTVHTLNGKKVKSQNKIKSSYTTLVCFSFCCNHLVGDLRPCLARDIRPDYCNNPDSDVSSQTGPTFLII
jgi:hypothetical protein